jgi:hypothetical protein
MSRKLVSIVLGAAILVCIGFAADPLAASKKYQAYLSPMPHNDAMHPLFMGKGTVIATIRGDTVSLDGAFTALSSPAVKAHLCVSMAAGIPGKPIFDFSVPNDLEGKLSGTFKLDKEQTSALQKGQIYIQIDSEKALNGNLWGWLLSEHEAVGQDVPQKGPWFLPEFAAKTR